MRTLPRKKNKTGQQDSHLCMPASLLLTNSPASLAYPNAKRYNSVIPQPDIQRAWPFLRTLPSPPGFQMRSMGN